VLLAAMLDAAPGATGVLFDRAEVADGARAAMARRGLADRVEVVSGDFVEAVPEGGDLYVIKAVLPDWSDDPATQILRHCHRASAPGGTLLIIELIVPSEPARSGVHLLDLHILALLGGHERTQAEYAAMLDTAGYRLERVLPLPGLQSIVEARRA